MSIPDILVTTFLEMRERSAFSPLKLDDPDMMIMKAEVPLVLFYRFLYKAVGERWRWVNRNMWTDGQLHNWLSRPECHLYVLYVRGTPAGYIELDDQGHSVEIAYFGLIADFFGHGYGKHLLSFGIEQAWALNRERIWVNTCNLDGPHALRTYQRIGFEIYDVQEQPMPDKYRIDV